MQLFRAAMLLALVSTAMPEVNAATPAASADSIHPLAAGAKAPTVTLPSMEGATVSLADAFARQPTILVFYRGSWCPYCNRHLAALGELEPQLLALGYQVIAVSPDGADDLKKMAAKNHLGYRLLSDQGMTASAAFGVAFQVPAEMEKSYREHGVTLPAIPGASGSWLPVPAVFIVNREGVIRFAHANPDYTIRLAPSELLAAAKAALTSK
jgi:peroxiredoxin